MGGPWGWGLGAGSYFTPAVYFNGALVINAACPLSPSHLCQGLYLNNFIVKCLRSQRSAGAHTRNIISYIKGMAEVGGGLEYGGRRGSFWKRLRSERLLFLITARPADSLKWIKCCNLAYTCACMQTESRPQLATPSL